MAWTLGFSGKKVYIPKRPEDKTIVERFKKRMLEEIVEAAYEERGTPFYERTRKQFSERFGTTNIASRYHLAPRTATRVASAVYRAWRNWFGHHERLHLERLGGLAEETGIGYEALYIAYLSIRKQLRGGQTVCVEDHTGYLSAPAEVIDQIIDLARASIESCSWRLSPNEG